MTVAPSLPADSTRVFYHLLSGKKRWEISWQFKIKPRLPSLLIKHSCDYMWFSCCKICINYIVPPLASLIRVNHVCSIFIVKNKKKFYIKYKRALPIIYMIELEWVEKIWIISDCNVHNILMHSGEIKNEHIKYTLLKFCVNWNVVLCNANDFSCIFCTLVFKK